ncbi:energy transducer TonB [Pelobium manganitolerans]|uniref:energy transducer TonB n=1 Tax=Pelobium manganitolerans TaxID=1842495 RepID=UPI003FA37FA6
MSKTLIFILFISFLIGSTAFAQPHFTKGDLQSFLSSEMRYPAYAKQHCIEGTVSISFKLDAEGTLRDVRVKKGLGIDLDDEAIRLIQLTKGKWKLDKNYDTTQELIVPIKFELQNYGCQLVPQATKQQAIMQYQARQGLENLVLAYYADKNLGKADPTKEAEILNLKAELGFDQEFVNEQLAQANGLLKNGKTEEACKILHFIKNIGFADADALIAANCK